MAEFETDRCRSCDAEIVWAVTERGRAMPVELEPASGGNVQLVARPPAKPLARVLSVRQQFGKTNLRKPHWAGCPQAKEWRSGRG